MNREEAIKELSIRLYGMGTGFWIKETEKLLKELPSLAIVDREAKLPGNIYKAPEWIISKAEIDFTMKEEGWVKELK